MTRSTSPGDPTPPPPDKPVKGALKKQAPPVRTSALDSKVPAKEMSGPAVSSLAVSVSLFSVNNKEAGVTGFSTRVELDENLHVRAREQRALALRKVQTVLGTGVLTSGCALTCVRAKLPTRELAYTPAVTNTH